MPETAVCAEGGCTAEVPATDENRCGGAADGGAQGCGEIFCDAHLWHSFQYGFLCADDHNGIDDRPGPDDTTKETNPHA
ncbi:hypothetical protein JOL79_11475 [Microbispora sp. RL4-1S]|uniref:Uncharacterized protein n=1 Tax=Microbispora oryzae TaxID=2806554 RepID=A0A940WF20_9ACTN|nr:hypothetical protein [Microbispora oryzae]MBP2704434.1 hypothetical protein [Microbispora oryzae]